MKNALFILLSLLLCGAVHASTPVAHVVKGSQEHKKLREQILSAKEPSHSSTHSMDEILPGLYLGDLASAYDVHRQPHISHVLSIIDNPKKIKANGIVWKGLRVADHPHSLIICHFNKMFAFIESARAGVLVHCRAGVSRSATFVIGYVMWKFDVSFDEAYKYVRSKRPHINPNDGFLAQLKYYELVKNGR